MEGPASYPRSRRSPAEKLIDTTWPMRSSQGKQSPHKLSPSSLVVQAFHICTCTAGKNKKASKHPWAQCHAPGADHSPCVGAPLALEELVSLSHTTSAVQPLATIVCYLTRPEHARMHKQLASPCPGLRWPQAETACRASRACSQLLRRRCLHSHRPRARPCLASIGRGNAGWLRSSDIRKAPNQQCMTSPHYSLPLVMTPDPARVN